MAREEERDINDILGDNIEKVRERVEEVRDRFEEVADKAKARSEEAWKDAVKFTQKHPVQSLGVAALIGAALGVLLFSRRQD
jgi:ElaB/YqjD/DUF883 family membrane-anchored ribosome-binding protein